jgi:hypothetical protein
MRTKQRRPGSEGGVYVSVGTKTTTTIQATTDGPPAAEHQLTSDLTIWDAYMAGLAAGYGQGLERGRQLAEDDMARRWAALAEQIRRRASMLSQDELAERRAS